MENYYQILGVAPTASADEIKSRFRFLAKAYHPDRFGDAESKAQAENELKRLNEAYAVLSNPEKRRAYDARIGVENKKAPGQASASSQAEEDQVNYKQATEMIAYLQQLEKRWGHILKPLPDLTRVYEASQYLHSVAISLAARVYPENTAAQNEVLVTKIDQRVFGMVTPNIFLGAEYEKYGYSRQFNPVELQILTSLPAQQLIFELFETGQKRGRLSEADIQEIGDTFARVLLLICELSQTAGRDAVKQREGSSRSASAQSQSAHSGTTWPYSARSSPIGREEEYCQSCFRSLPTKKVTFHRIIGVILIGLHKRIEGRLCADCIEKHFWEMTGLTLLAGWWSPPSLIATPFIVLLNLIRYLSAWDLRKTTNNLGNIALGWKIFTFTLIGIVAYILLLNSNTPYSNTKTSAFAVEKTPTRASTYKDRIKTPAPTSRSYILPPETGGNESDGNAETTQDCTPWSKVRASDKGKTLCVYGTVKNAYWGGDIYYMSFTDDPNAFRFIVLQGYYFEGVQGNCIMAEGIVKTYDKMPYIEVGENLWKCD